MDKDERLRSIWLSADESYINVVKESNGSSLNPDPNSFRSSATAKKGILKEQPTKSNDDNCSFIAVPEEFRPFRSKKEITSKASTKVDRFSNLDNGNGANVLSSCTEQPQTRKHTQEMHGVKVKKPGSVYKLRSSRGEEDYYQASETKLQEPNELSPQTEGSLITNRNSNGQEVKPVQWNQIWSESMSPLKQNETPEAVHSLKTEFDEICLSNNYGISNCSVGSMQSTSEINERHRPRHPIRWNSNLVSSEYQKFKYTYTNRKVSNSTVKMKNGTAVYSSVNCTFQKNIRWNGDLCFDGEFQRRNISYERYSITDENASEGYAEASEISKHKRLFLKPDFPISVLEDSDFDTICSSDSSSVSEGKTKSEDIRKITWMDKIPESSKRNFETNKKLDYMRNTDNCGKMGLKTEQSNIGFSKYKEVDKNKKRVNKKPRNKDNIIRHEVKIIHVYTPTDIKSHKGKEEAMDKESNDCLEMAPNRVGEKAILHDSREKDLEVSAVKESKDIEKSDNSTSTGNVALYAERLNLETSKARVMLIQYGKDISDLIVGCHRAVNMFMSFYHKWAEDRKKSIELVTALLENITKSQKNVTMYQNIFKLLGDGGTALSYIPNFYASITGRVLTFLTGMIGKFCSSTPNVKGSTLEEGKMLQIIELDVDSTSSVYTYGLECSSQFEDAGKIIKEFHQSILDGYYTLLFSDPEISDFLRDIVEFKVTHNIFYMRLCRCFQKFRNGNSTEVKRAFCTAFDDFPGAIDVIPHMNWRFDFLDNGDSVLQDTLREINELFSTPNSATIKELERVINNCVKVLTREQTLMDIHLKCFEKTRF